MTDTILIAGGGHAAGQTIVSLRQGGFDGRLILAGEEPYLPYQRPPLSKKFLAGGMDVDRLLLRHDPFYAEHGVDLRLGTRVNHIDRAAQSALLSSGETVHYGALVLATGSQVRRADLPGVDLPGVHYLRTIADVQAIRDGFRPGASLVVVGAGYIGLEVAAVAAAHGLRVTVVELAERVMARIDAPVVSDFFARVHQDAGVSIRCRTGVSAFRGDGRVRSVITSGGEELPADLVIVGIGVVPTVDLARDAGLPCDNGILVDEFCRTADPRILAVGDCTNHPNPLLGQRLRLESVHNAQEQAKTAAATILGKPEAYAQVPWFWSDQFDLKLQIVGLSTGSDQSVVRGDPDSRTFAAFFLAGGRLTAVYAINSPREFMLSKRLIAAGVRPDPALLADTATPFKEIAESLAA